MMVEFHECPQCQRVLPLTSEYYYPNGMYLRKNKCIDCTRLTPRNRRHCSACGEEKEFYKGFKCLDCVNRWHRERNNPVKNDGSFKKCSRCGAEKESGLENFYKNGASKDGLSNWCRTCFAIHAREIARKKRSTEEGRAQHRDSQAVYRKSQRGKQYKAKRSVVDNAKRRQRVTGAPFEWSIDLWKSCKEYWDYKCAYCGRADELTQDHFIPVTAPNFPGTIPGNMIPACPSCNYSKADRLPDDWCDDEAALQKIRSYFEEILYKEEQVRNG